MTDLDLAAVRAFVTAVDEGQFSHAAAVLGISQQAVSKRVAKLESQLGAALCDRVPAGVVATAAGLRLLPHARALLGAADDAVAAVRERLRPLRVAVLGERAAEMESLRFYLYRHPERDTEIVVSNVLTTTRDALLLGPPATARAYGPAHDTLVGGRVDAAFARAYGGPRALPSEIAAVPSYLEPLHLIVGKGHPLAGRAAVTFADIRPFPAWVPGTVVPSEWADYYRHLSEFSGITVEAGDRPEPIEDILDRLAVSDTLVSFTGEGFRTPWHPHIRRVPVVDPTPAYPHALLWSTANPHPGLPPLIEYFRDNYNGDIAAECWIPEPDRALFLR
ncbi:LysR family transcriptional regulator [Nocardia blacklockiae]|uniref:LysR family transcriptional regulator n=1 Tax=Nocardia blacklockiae TaxID=480036 RepID=UPI0018957C0C|nr:LysR family transcriptional regulator [Nocardia blacklockiae]MBF6170223.1 LysR family transcriptional regulator [Nocardia blacklockiae]